MSLLFHSSRRTRDIRRSPSRYRIQYYAYIGQGSQTKEGGGFDDDGTDGGFMVGEAVWCVVNLGYTYSWKHHHHYNTSAPASLAHQSSYIHTAEYRGCGPPDGWDDGGWVGCLTGKTRRQTKNILWPFNIKQPLNFPCLDLLV